MGEAPLSDFSIPACLNSGELRESALKELALKMTRATFDTWLRGTWIASDEPPPKDREGEERVVILARSTYAVDWLANRLSRTMVTTLSRLVGRPVRFEFATTESVELRTLPLPLGWAMI